MAESLSEELKRLHLTEDSQRRGYLLESLIARLFRKAHFDVDLNAAAARPRQTDLFARDGQSAYLIETRWRGKPVSSADVDDLHSRLKRTPSRVEGIMISVKGFTPEAMEEIESMRTERLVVPIDEEELRRFLADPDELRLQLRQKRNNLLVHGSVSRALTSATASAAELPQADISILDTEGRPQAFIAGRGSYSGLTFLRVIPDIDWVAAQGHGVTCDLRVGAESERQLLGVLRELAEIDWAGPRGQWTITQSDRVWHGFGPRDLAIAVEEQKARIAEVEHPHHTEELFYVDECPGGFYTLSAQPIVGRSRVWPVRISFQLEGVPLDTGPFQRLAGQIAPGEKPYFRPRSTASTSFFRLDRHLPLKAPATMVERDEHTEPQDWVVGVIACNPFYSEPNRLSALGIDLLSMGARLDENELLICDLPSWHLADEPQEYVLTGFEVASTSDVVVLRPLADWRHDASSSDLRVPVVAPD